MFDLSKVPGYQNGAYVSPDSKFRSLTRDEVMDLVQMASTTTPRFTGQGKEKTLAVHHGQVVERFGREDPDADAKWEDHHPITRAVWEARGIKG